MEFVTNLLLTITLILLAAWLISRLWIRRASEHDLLWRMVLLLVLISPVLIAGRAGLVNWQWSLPIWPVAQKVETDFPLQRSRANPESVAQGEPRRIVVFTPTTMPAAAEHLDVDVKAAASSAKVLRPVDSARSKRWAVSWVDLLGVIWSCGVVVHLVRLCLSIRNAILLYRSGQLMDRPSDLKLVEQCAHHVELSKTPQLATSPRIQSPVVVGCMRPRILIPASMSDDAFQSSLRAVVLHECGHIQRLDLFYELLLRCVLGVFWFHPLVHRMAYEIRRLREEMCDNFVLQHEPAVNYAETLLRVALGQRSDQVLLLGLGVVSRAQRLEQRISEILSPQRRCETSATHSFRVAMGGVLGLLIIGGLFVRITPAMAENPPLKQVSASVQNEPQSNPAPQSTEDPLQQQRERWLSQLREHPVEVSLQLVDSQDRPVVGAKVEPRGVSNVDGAFIDISINEKKLWTPVASDSEGRVRFVLPHEIVLALLTMQSGHNAPRAIQRFLKIPKTDTPQMYDQLGLRMVNLRIDHPNHPIWWDAFILRPNAKVKLSDSYTLTIRARRAGETSLARRVAPWLTGSRSADWSEVDGIITYRRVSLTELNKRPLLRVVQFPDAGPAWFSEVVDLKHLAGNPIEINATLKPGLRIEGRLSDNVPRPVKQGKVFGQIIHLVGKESQGSGWSIAADIAEDGSFVLDSVPAQENLQLMAVCEGWSSLPSSSEEIEAYQAQYNFPREQMSSGSAAMLTPRILRLDESNLQNVIVPMQETSACEITTVDEKNRPIPGVMIQFNPNVLFWHWGSSLQGATNDSTSLLRQQMKTGNHEYPSGTGNNASEFSVMTNDEGVAVITGLPAAPPDVPENQQLATYFANHEKYTPISSSPIPMARFLDMPFQFAKLAPGQTTQQTVRMKLRPEPFSTNDSVHPHPVEDVSDSTPEARMSIAGRVTDEQNQPLADVKILFGGMDCFDIQSNADGDFRHVFPAEMVEGGDEAERLPLQFVKPGYAPQFVEVSLGDRNIEIQLDQNTWLEGVVRKPDGSPAANIPVRGFYLAITRNDFPTDFPLKSETMTDAEGRYRLMVETAGYQLTAGNAETGIAWLPKNVSETPGDPTKLWIAPQEHRQVDIQLGPSVRFQAEFLNSVTGQPISGVYLFVEDAPQSGLPEEEELHKADATGRLVLSEFPAGKYRVQIPGQQYLRCFSKSAVDEREHNPGFTPTRDGLVFDFQPGMDPVCIYLEPGVEVNGVVLDPEGKPVPNSEVYLGYVADEGLPRSRPYYGQHTDQSGQFKILLPSGDETRYRLVACSPEKQKWAAGVSQAFHATVDKSVESLEIRLSEPGSVQGRAVDEHGQPLASVTVRAWHTDGLEKDTRLPSTISARDGSFELRGLRPGRYLLHSDQLPEGVFQDPSRPQTDIQPRKTNVVGDVIITSDE